MKNLNLATLVIALTFCSNIIAQPVNLRWVKQQGGSGSDAGQSIAIDTSGNVFTIGAFSGTADFNPNQIPAQPLYLTSFGLGDIFVSKRDVDGNLIWVKQFGGAAHDVGISISLDASGNIYISGFFSGKADFNPEPDTVNVTPIGGRDVFVAKLDTFGHLIWVRHLGSNQTVYCTSIAVNSIGNVSMTGYFTGMVDFDPGNGTYKLIQTGNSFSDIFVATLDAMGNFLWAGQFGGGTSQQIGASISVDASGNVYTTGQFGGTVDFNPDPSPMASYPLTSIGNYDVYVSKLDASGNFIWAKRMGGGSGGGIGTRGKSITLDADGNVYTTGFLSGKSDFDPGPPTFNLESVGYTDIFISKLDASGAFIWAKNMGGCSSTEATSIAVDINGNVYTTGSFYCQTDFDPDPNKEYTLISPYISGSNYGSDIFVSKLDSIGRFVWAINMGGYADEGGLSIKADTKGNVYTTGYFSSSTVDFDPSNGTYNLNSLGSNDVFIEKLCQIEIPALTGPSQFCQGDSITLIATEGYYSYLWSNGDTTQSIIVKSPNNYKVTVTNISGCDAVSATKTISVLPLPNATITPSGPTTFCQGKLVKLTANTSSSYLWSNGASTKEITVGNPGDYTLIVTNINGCSSQPVSITINVNPLPDVQINPEGSSIFCQGDSVELTASPTGLYFWSNGSFSPSITVFSTGNYIVTVTDGNGCSSTNSSSVTVNSLPVVNIESYQDTILTASGTGSIFLWSTGDTTQSIIVNSMGLYSVTVTNNDSCTASDTFLVTFSSSQSYQVDNYKITVSPNPTNELIHISFQGIAASLVQIMDNTGRILIKDQSTNLEGSTRTLNVENLAPGLYYLETIGVGFTITVAFIKF